MSRIRTIKSQSRPAPTVASEGVRPTVRRTTNGKTKFKLNDKPKVSSNGSKKIIRFKGYHDLVDLSLEKSAKKLNYLLDPEVEKKNSRKISKTALKDFLRFSKKNIIKKDGSFGISPEGYLSVDWDLPKGVYVSIEFHGNNEVELKFITRRNYVQKLIPFSSIVEILKHYSVPVC